MSAFVFSDVSSNLAVVVVHFFFFSFSRRVLFRCSFAHPHPLYYTMLAGSTTTRSVSPVCFSFVSGVTRKGLLARRSPASLHTYFEVYILLYMAPKDILYQVDDLRGFHSTLTLMFRKALFSKVQTHCVDYSVHHHNMQSERKM